ncbi:VOC family protein [Roseateles sp. BYS87W]|uniref:VOC family protein n=1 Tax=Pelomonas baiyunensis TaxID=3299026 RepID=A0ABW7H2Z6_9BURK
MSVQTTTHLNFRGDARSALEFYQSVFGGQLIAKTYADFGMPAQAPGAQHVVFGLVAAGNGFRVMAYDIPGPAQAGIAAGGATRREQGLTHTDQACFVSISADSLDEARRYWEALAVGGTVVESLAASQWSAGFGMLTDRFGVTWSVSVTAR